MDATKIAKRPVSNVASILEGTIAGIQVNNTYGQPGDNPTVRIRGFNSVNGDNSPLYVLDGVPFGGNISDLNSADIESISVLKDAASSALYGNRAANSLSNQNLVLEIIYYNIYIINPTKASSMLMEN